MKALILIASLIANFVLAVLVLKSPSTTSATVVEPARPRVVKRTVVQQVEETVVTNAVMSPGPVTSEPFHWSAIQSTNFPEYAAQLLAMGCPPQTVRDIITGEINDWMLKERRELFAPYAGRFWEFAAQGVNDLPPELKQPMGELKKERARLLGEALKNVPKVSEASRGNRRIDPTLEMLSDEQRAKIDEIEKRYVKLIRETSSNKELKPEDRAKALKELSEKRDAEKHGVMSPEELAEYKVRLYGEMFTPLHGFDVSLEERRKIAEVHARHPERTPAMEKEVEALLGEKRYQEYRRAQDETFQSAWKLTQAFDLPEDTAVRAYALDKEWKNETAAVKADRSLTPEQRRAALQEIDDAAHDAMAQVLGQKAYAAWERIQNRR